MQSSRERDEISLKLGDPEHTGCMRGLGKRLIRRRGGKRTQTFTRSMEGNGSQVLRERIAQAGLGS